MKFKEYKEHTDKTWNHKDSPQEELDHALLGLIDESGELASALKRKVGYGKEIDLVNVKEEIGDGVFFLTRVMVLLYKEGEPRDAIAKLFNDIIDMDIPEDKLKEMKMFSEIDIIYNLSIPITSIYIGLTSGDNNKAANAVSDVLSAYNSIAAIYDFTLTECLQSNVAKLEKRYKGESFSEESATDRDLKGEKEVLSKKE